MTTQLDASIGFKKETTFGTAVTVDRFLEFTDESLDYDRSYYQGSGLRPGSRAARSGRRVLTRDGGAGDIGLEVPTKGIGTLLELLLGVGASALVSGSVYQQLFTPIGNDYLPSATIQKGIPRLGANVVDAYTFRGAVCSSFEFSASSEDVLKLKTTWKAKDVDTSIAYATPSYPSAFELFSFVGASLTLGGSVTPPTGTALATGGTAANNVRDFTLTVDNGLDGNGYNLGGGGKLTRPPAVGALDIKGKITAEYSAQTLRDAVRDQTPMALVINFVGLTEISVGQPPTLQITLPDIRLEGELPKSNAGDVIVQSIDFTAFDNLTASKPIYIAVRTADTAL